ncbi:MAG: hypothetical protein ACTSR1_07250 [Candidatus Heimdallarchaeota archaeon]
MWKSNIKGISSSKERAYALSTTKNQNTPNKILAPESPYPQPRNFFFSGGFSREI